MSAFSPWALLMLLSAGVAAAEPSPVVLAPKPGLTLSLSAGYRAYSDASRQVRALFGMAHLAIPLEQLSFARASPPPKQSAESQYASGTKLAQVTPAEDARRQDAAPDARRQQPVTKPSRAVRLRVTTELAKTVVQAALQAHGFAAQAPRLVSLKSRSKTSALLPEVRLRALRSLDEQLRLTPTLDDPYRYTQAGGEDLTLEARLTWRLSRLVFAREELAIERLVQQRDNQRTALVKRVLKALFQWQKALLALTDELLSDADRAEATLKELEARVELEVLMGGRFTLPSAGPSAGGR